MFTVADKQAIVAALADNLARMIETALHSVNAAREGIQVGSERTRNRGERGQFMEETYLITAQMRQVENYQLLLRTLAGLDLRPARKAQAGSLLTVAEEHEPAAAEAVYFLIPGAMGLSVDYQGRAIHLASPDSPLGQALMGKRAGSSITLPARGGTRIQTLKELS